MSRFLYFAYGSNMLTARLRARCPSASPVGTADAEGLAVAFRKRSRDGSGKATLVRSAEADRRCRGVLFEIDRDDLPSLDAAEGAGSGYDRIDDFRVRRVGDGRILRATTYRAPRPEEGLKPYCWYLALVVAGAREHGLDERYIDALRRVAYENDPDQGRRGRLEAIEAFTRSGCPDYRLHLPGHPG